MVASAMISAVKHAFIDEACYSPHDNQVNTIDIDSEIEAARANCVTSQID